MNLKPTDVDARDICWALSNICRYGGHCHRPYSVGEHTLRVFRREPTLEALLHDASEAYLGDIPTPLKRRMPSFIEAERRVQEVIAEAFGLNANHFRLEIEHGSVKVADLDELKHEQGFLWTHASALSDGPTQLMVAAQLFSALKSTTRIGCQAALGLDRRTILN